MEKEFEEMINGAQKASACLKALSHEFRLLIMCHIASGEKSVQELEAYLGTSQSNVSQHLAKMKSANLLTCRKDSNMVYYRVKDPNLLQLISHLQKIFC
jgi:DNA-binding transcriptional ArsR family regulator